MRRRIVKKHTRTYTISRKKLTYINIFFNYGNLAKELQLNEIMPLTITQIILVISLETEITTAIWGTSGTYV